MISWFTNENGSLLLRLIVAHLTADFYLQRGNWIQSKMEKNMASPYLWLHTGIAAGLAWLAVWNLADWWVFVATFITHFATDAWKTIATKKVVQSNYPEPVKARKELQLFVLDQIFHFVALLLIWLILVNGFAIFVNRIEKLLSNNHFLLLLLGYILVLQPTGFLIGFVTKRWLPELNMKDSLRDAGTWIGMLERAIVLTLIYANQFGSIGFLIAAKSILRVTDKPERKSDDEPVPFSSRKHTEYVLIGTFLSFGCALITGLVIRFLMR